MPTPRRLVDERFLGLDDEGFVVAPHLSRFDRRLYGGTAIAVSLAAIERATDRDAVWATTQFTSTALTGARIHVRPEVLKAGRRTSQVQVTATDDAGEIVFVALGAAADPKPDGLTGTPEHMPTVTPPEDGKLTFTPSGPMADVGWHLASELRTAKVLDHSDQAAGRIALWTRMVDGDPWTAARLAFVADMVPVSVARGSGVHGVGTSLDNTLRVGSLDDAGDGWVLVDLRPHLASGGYGHGTVHLWTPGGVLLATGSQTASMIVFEHDPFTGNAPL